MRSRFFCNRGLIPNAHRARKSLGKLANGTGEEQSLQIIDSGPVLAIVRVESNLPGAFPGQADQSGAGF